MSVALEICLRTMLQLVLVQRVQTAKSPFTCPACRKARALVEDDLGRGRQAAEDDELRAARLAAEEEPVAGDARLPLPIEGVDAGRRVGPCLRVGVVELDVGVSVHDLLVGDHGRVDPAHVALTLGVELDARITGAREGGVEVVPVRAGVLAPGEVLGRAVLGGRRELLVQSGRLHPVLAQERIASGNGNEPGCGRDDEKTPAHSTPP
jgi:hypothetical protein